MKINLVLLYLLSSRTTKRCSKNRSEEADGR